MGMTVAVLFLVVSVSLTEAAGCIPTTSPMCYKNSTKPEEDFICKWDKTNPKESQTHTLCIWHSDKRCFIMCENSGNQSEKYIPLEDLGITTRKMDIWVQTQVGNLTCNSSKISVILECLVKYSKPQITSMTRSDGNLSLQLDKPIDDKGVKYEIRWRERGSKWENAMFETEDSTNQDSYKLHLQKQTIYQIQLRRQAKLQPHLCKDSLPALWSDWSTVVDVPLEIRLPLVRWVEKKWMNGTRHINLMWDEPPAEESVGGVKYKLNVTVWPCEKPERKEKSTLDRTYKISITYSEARISIIATNKVGSSRQQKIIIPAVKHLSNCDKPSNITKARQTCLEWYKLENGENRTSAVNSLHNIKSFKDIKKGVEKFVRHYYFLHTMRKKLLQTVDMCPFYSEQGAPIKGPGNVHSSDVTHESAVVSWLPIPVVEQRGFLLHYLIWISGQGITTLHNVHVNETSFPIKNLQPGVSYTVSIAGETIAGKGPNSTVNFETSSKEMGLSWQSQTILSVCVVGFLCTIICSVAVRRFRNKLMPEVPTPVIDTAEIICPQDQDMRQMTEEVHEFVLLLRQDLSKPIENVTPEQSTLLKGFGLVVFEDEEDEEDEVTDLWSMKSCCYPNPSYRGQTLQLPDPFHPTDSTLKDSDTESTYKNGLFFETRILESEKTSL